MQTGEKLHITPLLHNTVMFYPIVKGTKGRVIRSCLFCLFPSVIIRSKANLLLQTSRKAARNMVLTVSVNWNAIHGTLTGYFTTSLRVGSLQLLQIDRREIFVC